jgi:hypothetical protein
MIHPQRAAVRPRVHPEKSGESLLLEDEVREHLAAALPAEQRLLFLDDPRQADIGSLPRHGIVIHATLVRSKSERAEITADRLAVSWPGANLRGADLRGASFHLGSTRSGLVGSPIACEGSRTGFYTDDYDEQTYKPPEEIRKANLCGADLRGANLDGVDFYLVDLRGAVYDPEQEVHLRRCGAILEARV